MKNVLSHGREEKKLYNSTCIIVLEVVDSIVNLV